MFKSTLKQIFILNGKKKFNDVYGESFRLDLMLTIVNESSKYSQDELIEIFEECDSYGMDIFNYNSITKLYDQAIISGTENLQKYMYGRYHSYFVQRLIRDITSNNKDDFDFLLKVIPKGYLDDLKEDTIDNETINNIILKSQSVEMLREIFKVLDMPIDNKDSLISSVESDEIDTVKFLLTELKDVKFYSQAMTEAIKKSQDLKYNDITTYLKTISNPRLGRALGRVNNELQRIKVRNDSYTDEFLQDQFDKSEIGQELGLSEKKSLGLPWLNKESTMNTSAVVSSGGARGLEFNIPDIRRTPIPSFNHSASASASKSINNGRVRVSFQQPSTSTSLSTSSSSLSQQRQVGIRRLPGSTPIGNNMNNNINNNSQLSSTSIGNDMNINNEGYTQNPISRRMEYNRM